MSTSKRAQDLATSAFTLFSQKGISSVTMDDIASDANVTKGSLYWHYKSKDEVIQASCRHYYQHWHQMAQQKLASVSDPVERLRTIIRASVRSCLIDEKNRIFTLEILTLSLYDESIRMGWQQFFDGVRGFYIGLVQAAASELELESCEQAVDSMLATMEGYKLRAVFEPHLCKRSAEANITRDLLARLNVTL